MSGVAGTTSPDPSVELLAPLPAGVLLAVVAGGVVALGADVLRRRDVAG